MIYQRLKMKMFLEYLLGFFLKKILSILNYLIFDINENNKMNKS
jgi:hypothetical protein